MKQIYFLTPFPDVINAVVSESILGRAEKKEFVQFYTKNLFDFSDPPHHRIDDYPFGGGVGMVLKPEPVFRAFNDVVKALPVDSKPRVVFPTPDGHILTHEMAINLCKSDSIIFINGHYKGIDQRIRDELVTDEISIGDYVLSGGELAAAVFVDAIGRLIPGVLSDESSALTDSFQDNLLAPPVYTRPREFQGYTVPDVLLSGDQKKIDDWRYEKALELTKKKRPDLLK